MYSFEMETSFQRNTLEVVNTFAMFLPTCSNISGVYLGGNDEGGGGVARPLSWQAGGMEFMVFPVL